MNILYLCAYKKNIVGGVPSVVPQYLKYMSEWADVYVFSFGGVEFQESKETYYQVRSMKEVFMNLENFDIVVFHEVYYLSYYKLAKRLIKDDVPYIVIPHCSLTQGAQERKKILKKVINKIWVNQFINQASRIQYSSTYEKESSRCFPSKSIIIPNGIPLVTNISKQYVEHDSIEFIFIGRLSVKQKGLDLLIDACELIRDEMVAKNINISLYGSDFEGGKEYIQGKINEYKLAKNVKLYNPIYGQEKQRILLASDIYILTSRYEGLPMMLLEAMQIGLPLLVTPGTGCLEIVQKEKCGWGVEEDIVSISKGILQVAEERDKLPTMSANALKAVENYYEWSKVIVNTKAEYEKVIQDKQKGVMNDA